MAPVPRTCNWVFFRANRSEWDLDLILNEDYFYEEEALLNNLRMAKGIIVFESIDGRTSPQAVERPRRTGIVKPAITESARKETGRKRKQQTSVASASSEILSSSPLHVTRRNTKGSTDDCSKRPKCVGDIGENTMDYTGKDGVEIKSAFSLRELIARAEKDLAPNQYGQAPVGRDDEMEKIHSMLAVAAESFEGGSVYICGAPGLGKTFTINKVIERVMSERNKYENTPIILRGQGTCMTSSQEPYSHLVLSTFNEDVFSEEGLSEAKCREVFFNYLKRKKGMTFLLIDEVDHTYEQTLVELLDACSEYKLFIIGIANSINLTISLPLRDPRRHQQLLFEHYTEAQLMTILTERCHGLLAKNAMLFLAKKIISAEGDVRVMIEVALGAIVKVGKVLSSKELDAPLDTSAPPADLKAIIMSLQNMGLGASNPGEFVMKATPHSRMLLVALLLNDPEGKR